MSLSKLFGVGAVPPTPPEEDFSKMGLGAEPQAQAPAQSQERALPASWYRSTELYDLERRAIFSRKWMLLTHQLRLGKAGDYVSFRVAGIPFFLIRGRDDVIRGFHNVCRHRAYPVITKEGGNASILSCKYHGWSYGFKGNLAKAPRFDTVPDFDKTQHGLYPVHVHVDSLGFVWANLEAGEKTSVAWEDDFDGADTQERLAWCNKLKDYHFDHTWSMVGDYNWKECYHCATTHQGVADTTNLDVYYVIGKGGQILHFSTPKDLTDANTKLFSTFLFPNANFTVTAFFFYIQRCTPVSATESRMEYEVYRHNDATDEEFGWIDKFYKQVLREDKDLCNAAQKNLNAGIFTNGQLHPEKEKGPIYFQKLVRELVMDHRNLEKANGGVPIWPATPKLTADMKTTKLDEEERFCAELEGGVGKCGASDPAMEW